jgi:hypothetical protein
MTEDSKPKEVIFAPGCFDNFEGTQEELDEMIAEIQRMFESGDDLVESHEVDLEELFDTDPEMAEKIINSLNSDPEQRKLQ